MDTFDRRCILPRCICHFFALAIGRFLFVGQKEKSVEEKINAVRSVFHPKIDDKLQEIKCGLLVDNNWEKNIDDYINRADKSFRESVRNYLAQIIARDSKRPW